MKFTVGVISGIFISLIFFFAWFLWGIEYIEFGGSSADLHHGGYSADLHPWSISTDYFKNDLKKTCDYLERHGCKCEPRIELGSGCDLKVPNLIGEVYLSKGGAYYDQSE